MALFYYSRFECAYQLYRSITTFPAAEPTNLAQREPPAAPTTSAARLLLLRWLAPGRRPTSAVRTLVDIGTASRLVYWYDGKGNLR